MKYILFLLLAVSIQACGPSKQNMQGDIYNEPHRPQVHFSPAANWMNDPNGMFFYNNIYHLFYQYYPDSTIWGPMHWGHATSSDLVHWQHQPVALYPDSLGYIFSGSAVVDSNNTSGFGTNGKVPLVAIFTHHDPVGEKRNTIDYQVQSIAYSLDDGKSWEKYSGNPVLKNPGIKDFRDPKVMWYEEGKKWIMTLATLDRISFYSSPDLKSWIKESEIGNDFGAHGGVWECPDLFQLDYNGEKIWVLLVSINPGGPNSGSATQYFTGKFDGKTFTPFETDIRWIDHGPDNYAGVTWSNTGNRKIFIGWMSNWLYANQVPTDKWRSAMTVPRELSLGKIGNRYYIQSQPVKELSVLEEQPVVKTNILSRDYMITNNSEGSSVPAKITLKGDKLQEFGIIIENESGEKVVVGYDASKKQYFIDRSQSGKISFNKDFAGKHIAPRLSITDSLDLTLIIDNASVELFADGGLTTMTSIFFPTSPYTKIRVQSPNEFAISSLIYTPLTKIW